MDRSRWIDSGVRVVRGLDLGPGGGAGIVVGPKSNRPRAFEHGAADDRSIAPVNAARDAAVRARSARWWPPPAPPRDRERPEEPGSNLAPGVAGSAIVLPPRRGVAARAADDDREDRVGDRRGRVAISEVVSRRFVS